MAGHRAGELHLGVRGGDAPVVLAVRHHLPAAVDLADLEYRAAMRGHLDVRHVLRHLAEAGLLGILRTREAGKHDLLVGVLVIDHEQAMLGTALEREVADEIVVVAELLLLRRGGLRVRVERWGSRQDRVTPTDQDVGAVARGDVMGLIDAGLDLSEPEGGLGRRRLCPPSSGQGQRRHGRSHRRHGQRVLH